MRIAGWGRPAALWLLLAASAMAGVDYSREVKPILKSRCWACHGALKQESGLRLDTGAAIRSGGDSGPAVVPGNPGESYLLQRVAAEDPADRMPPEGEGAPLTAEEIELIRKWVAEGATSPADEEPQIDPREYWSYQPIRRPEPPRVARADWVRTPVDAFIAARHEELGLVPLPEADRATWLQRVYLDLIGLPPTRSELHAFLNDSSADACERVVDDLLNRPEYGERWGRHWMDVWRYSDWYGSRAGNEIRYSQRHIWRWRDWIVESLNADKGYDRMVMEMLSGDELAPSDPDVLRATGFIGRNWYKFDRNVWMFEAVEHTAQAFLGLTMRCARCHDHKYDPISQEEYYRFRAYFEPHDVRTDPVSAEVAVEKDAKLGAVPADGVARVYDKTLDAPTYVFRRGDSRSPDESRPMTPGVPEALGVPAGEIKPVALPIEAYYPSLRPPIREGMIAAARRKVAAAESELQNARSAADAARRRLSEFETQVAAGTAAPPPAPVLQDDFESRRDDVWKVRNGEWKWSDGQLTQQYVTDFATIVSQVDHPRDFRVRVVYRTLAAGPIRSVGFSFDYVDQGNSQDVYTYTGDAKQTVQAFHRQNGNQVYPAEGIVPVTLKLGEPVVLECEVRGPLLEIRLNGERKLDYIMPVPRRTGKFALWVHQGAAAFDEIVITPLVPTIADYRREALAAEQAVVLGEARIRTTQSDLAALEARIAAELARYTSSPDAGTLAMAASRAEREAAALLAREALLKAEHQRDLLQFAVGAAAEGGSESAVVDAVALRPVEEAVAAARSALEEAQTAVETADGTYTPLGETFPATSSGRRLALARWIASAENPRTARVAVNHIWLRHFGEALVPSVDNFGLNGAEPSHPELLDWLATELVANDWRMKPIHRLIVLSSTYRMSSATSGDSDSVAGRNRTIDPTNRYLWRMNSRRMEAEVVRDALLAAAGTLDPTPGGPEIPETDALTVLRRSMYFRITPNEKAQILELFDVADPNQCYRRRQSVIPQQALALLNSGLALDQSRIVAERLSTECGLPVDPASDVAFIHAAFEQVLNRAARPEEVEACRRYLEQEPEFLAQPDEQVFPKGGQSERPASSDPRQHARENLILVLFSHNDFVTIR